MPPRSDELDLDLRYGHMRRAQANQPRLPGNLRQLGAVGASVPPPPAGSPQVIVKTMIARPTTTSSHLRYLQHGKGLDGQDVALFGARERDVDLQRLRQDVHKDPHQFRVIIAPGQGSAASLQLLVRTVMQEMQRSLRRPLDWVGAVHQDTAHLHAHVVLRGRDRDGKDLYLDKQYLSHGMRRQAQTIARYVLGKARSPGVTQGREPERQRERGQGMER